MDTEHIPLDCDVFAMDNSKTKKEVFPESIMEKTGSRPWLPIYD